MGSSSESSPGLELLLKLNAKNKFKNPILSTTHNKNDKEFSEIDVQNFIKSIWLKLIYPDYPVTSENDPACVFNFINNEENWNVRLNNLKKENLSLNGLSGLALGLLLSITDGSTKSPIVALNIENAG
jgi:hypothetical protein